MKTYEDDIKQRMSKKSQKQTVGQVRNAAKTQSPAPKKYNNKGDGKRSNSAAAPQRNNKFGGGNKNKGDGRRTKSVEAAPKQESRKKMQQKRKANDFRVNTPTQSWGGNNSNVGKKSKTDKFTRKASPEINRSRGRNNK